MAQLTDSQFNVQWDILQSSDNGLLDPLNEMSNEPAILSSQNVQYYTLGKKKVVKKIYLTQSSVLRNLHI